MRWQHAMWCAVMLRAAVIFQNVTAHIVLFEARAAVESPHRTSVLQFAILHLIIIFMHQLTAGCLLAMDCRRLLE